MEIGGCPSWKYGENAIWIAKIGPLYDATVARRDNMN